jgi:heat-inducible transcriptional repressor
VSGGKITAEGALNERAQHFLKILIERYIREGTPVGSRTLARDAGLDLSPATIRNVMSDLEECGLVTSPHTSAGRVPTIQGYRMFVDSLLSLQPLDEEALRRFRRELQFDSDDPHLLESASRILSRFTHMAGVVMVPRREAVQFRQIEFLPLSESRILVILISSSGEVTNRIIVTNKHYSPAQLEQAANYLNRTYSGQSMHDVRKMLLNELRETRADMDKLMAEAIMLAEQAFGEEDEKGDYVLSGQTNLMDFTELAEMPRLRGLFDAFTEKSGILHLLDECLNADGVQIFIGEESGYQPFDDCSVIAAPYSTDDNVVGVLGVIGPTRMAYDRVIPIVDVTAKLLGAALKR